VVQRPVVVSGSTGSGKSTLANAIAADLSCAVGSFDWLMSALRAMPDVWAVVELPIERQRQVGWQLLSRLAEHELRGGRSVVLDLVAREAPCREWSALASRHGAQFAVVECVCSDVQLLRSRVEHRQRDIPGWYELTWLDLQRSREAYVPLAEPKLVVDAARPLDENLARVRDSFWP
jgi:predicted kinase